MTKKVAEAVPLHAREDRQVLIFLHVSDRFWGSCVTQVSLEELNAGGPVADMSHEPLAFLSGGIQGIISEVAGGR